MGGTFEYVKRVVSEARRFGEVVAGSEADRELSHHIKALFEESCRDADVKLIPVTVLSWEDRETLVEAGGRALEAKSFPYTLKSDVEGEAVYVDDCISLVEKPRDLDGRVAITKLPEDLDDVERCYLTLVELGAVAVVFSDRFPSRRRRIVVTGSWSFSFDAGSPPPVPAVHVRSEDLSLLTSSRSVRVLADTRVSHGATGYIVEARLDGRREEAVLATGHHDHWLSGAHDNLVSVAFLALALKEACRSGARRTLVAVSFTAEESGAPGFAGWYWAYGSRVYVTELAETGRIDDVLAVVNVDTPARGKLHLASTPELRASAAKLVPPKIDGVEVVFEEDNPYMDSISFSTAGVPSLSIHSLDHFHQDYHTDADDLGLMQPAFIDAAYRVYRRLLSHLLSSEAPIDYGEAARSLYMELAKGSYPLEVLSAAYRLHRLIATRPEAGARAFRELLRAHYRPYLDGDYKHGTASFKAALFPQLLVFRDLRILSECISERGACGDCLKRVPWVRVIPGWEVVAAGLSSPYRTRSLTLGREYCESLLRGLRRLALKVADQVASAIDRTVERFLAG